MGSPKRYEWPEETIETLCIMKKRNYSCGRIAKKLSEQLHLVISAAMVLDCWNQLIDMGYFEDNPDYERAVAKTLKNRNRRIVGNPTHCPKRASLLHLLDLKQKDAGYVLDSTDMYQEGIFFPATKIYDQGKVLEDIFLCLANQFSSSGGGGTELVDAPSSSASSSSVSYFSISGMP